MSFRSRPFPQHPRPQGPRPQAPRPHGPRRALRWLALGGLAAALALAGCGDKNLILRVDILSFLSPAETHAHYGPIPGGLSDSLNVTSRSLTLLPGIKDITVVQNVEIDAAGVFANTTGSGSGYLKIYLSPEGTDPFTADPTPIVLPVTLAPATTDTVRVVVSGSQQLKDLFVANKAQLGIRASLTATPGPQPVEGDFTLTELRAVVTASQGITTKP